MDDDTCDRLPVYAGVDTHSETHHAAVISVTGQELGHAEFPVSADGYRALEAYITGFGPLLRVGVEGTGSYGAGETRHLQSTGITVEEVLRPSRRIRRARAKTDQIDAFEAARTVMSRVTPIVPKAGDGPVEGLRVTMIAYRSAVKARTQAKAQITSVLVSAPEALRARYRGMRGARRINAIRASRPTRSPDPVAETNRTVLVRLAQRVKALDAEIDAAEVEMRDLVIQINPALLQVLGSMRSSPPSC